MSGPAPFFAFERAQRVIHEVRGVKAQYGINEYQWRFLNDLVERRQIRLTVAQRELLEACEHKAFVVGDSTA